MGWKHQCGCVAASGICLLGLACAQALTEVRQHMLPQEHTVDTEPWLSQRVRRKVKTRSRRTAGRQPTSQPGRRSATSPAVEVAQATAALAAQSAAPPPTPAKDTDAADPAPPATQPSPAAADDQPAQAPSADPKPDARQTPAPRPVTSGVKPATPAKRPATPKPPPAPGRADAPETPGAAQGPTAAKPPRKSEPPSPTVTPPQQGKTKPPGPGAAPETGPAGRTPPTPQPGRTSPTQGKPVQQTDAGVASGTPKAPPSTRAPPGRPAPSAAADAPPTRRRTAAVRYGAPKPAARPSGKEATRAEAAPRLAPVQPPKVAVKPAERQMTPTKAPRERSDRPPAKPGPKVKLGTPGHKHQPRPPAAKQSMGWADPRIRELSDKVVDLVVAEVNGEILLGEEVLGGLGLELSRAKAKQTPTQFDKFLERKIEERLEVAVRKRLVLQQAEKELDEAHIKHIERQADKQFVETIEELKRNENVKTLAELRLKLEAKGHSLGRMKRQNRDSLVSRSFLSQKLRPRIFVTRDEMLTYYNAHIDQFRREERILWRQIMVRFADHGNKEKGRVAAEQVHKELVSGADFAELARRTSGIAADKGGDMGWTHPGSLSTPALARAVESLKPGQISGVIEGKNAWHIVRVDKHEQALTTPFGDADAQKRIRREVSREKEKVAIEKYIDELKKKAHIRTIFHEPRGAPSAEP